MDSASKAGLVVAFAVTAVLLPVFGGRMATVTMMSGGMMGSTSTRLTQRRRSSRAN